MTTRAFTLSELLIALAILGLIATFTIPKIITNLNNNNRNAIYKETFAALSEATHAGILSSELNETNIRTYFAEHINATGEGCLRNRRIGRRRRERGIVRWIH